MSTELHIADARRRTLRWTILMIVDKSRDVYLSEQIMLSVAGEIVPDTSVTELRQECAFLKGKSLLKIKKEKNRASYLITSEGTEFVEYDADDIKSIGRPPKYY